MTLSIAIALIGCSTNSAIRWPSWCRLRRSIRASHSSHRCAALSSAAPHNLQLTTSSRPTMPLHLLMSGWCPVLKRVRSTRSPLVSAASSPLRISLTYTSLRCPCVTSSSSLIPLRITASLVDPVRATSSWSIPHPWPASRSASSLPGSWQWPGTHTRVSLRPPSCSLHSLSRRAPSPSACPLPCRASISDRLSVATAALCHSRDSPSHLTASSMATISAG